MHDYPFFFVMFVFFFSLLQRSSSWNAHPFWVRATVRGLGFVRWAAGSGSATAFFFFLWLCWRHAAFIVLAVGPFTSLRHHDLPGLVLRDGHRTFVYVPQLEYTVRRREVFSSNVGFASS